MNNGFVVLHRKILDNPIWRNENLVHLFITLLLMASHKEERFLWNGKEEVLKRGQLLTGRLKLGELLAVNPNTIYKRLKILKNLGIINIKSSNKFSVITIVKYSQYQDRPTQKEGLGNNKVTTKEQQSNTYNNNNNVNNILSKPKTSPKSSFSTIEDLLASKQKHLVLIGFYLKATKKTFDTPEELTVTVKRWMRDASAIAKFGEDKINEAFTEAKEKYPDIWNLGTVLKILTK